MISLAVAVAMGAAAPNPGAITQPRKNYAACLNKFSKTNLADKVEPAAFSAALKTACVPEAAALKKALIDYDVAMGTKRAAAEENAALDLEGYTQNIEESYKEHFQPST